MIFAFIISVMTVEAATDYLFWTLKHDYNKDQRLWWKKTPNWPIVSWKILNFLCSFVLNKNKNSKNTHTWVFKSQCAKWSFSRYIYFFLCGNFFCPFQFFELTTIALNAEVISWTFLREIVFLRKIVGYSCFLTASTD